MQENNENNFKIILYKNLELSFRITIFVLSMIDNRDGLTLKRWSSE